MLALLPILFLAQLAPPSHSTATTEIPTAAVIPQDPFHTPLIQEVQALHDKSQSGDKKATKELVSKLEKLTQAYPENYLLLSYLGSAYTLTSRDAFPGPSKLKYLKKGLKTMDLAVKANPEDIPPRFIRAINNFHLPAFINRRDNARKDFKILLTQIQTHETGFHKETIQAIHYYAGLAYKQQRLYSEANAIWTEGLTIDHTSSIAQKMSKEINRLKL